MHRQLQKRALNYALRKEKYTIQVMILKRKIEQLLNGKFEYSAPPLVMLPEEVTVKVEPGEVMRGTLWIESPDGKKVRGFLYSSNPRMICEPTEFQGIKSEIHYQVDGNGFPEEEEEHGAFTVCSDRGEYTVPYTLIGQKKQQNKTETLPFAHPQDLAALAEQDFAGAYRSFISRSYRDMLRVQEPELLALYDALAVPDFSYQTMEEFLTGAGYKDPVKISVDRQSIVLNDMRETVGEKLQITRSQWGFQKITAESDAEFLRPERQTMTTDSFAGSTCELNLIVDYDSMHAGKNYGKVTLSTPYQKLCIEVTAEKHTQSALCRQRHICHKMQKKLEQLYVSFRLKKISLSDWVERSMQAISMYKSSGGDDPFADLFLIQLYFADGKKQKAIHLLESVTEHKERLRTPEQYGFYRYLTTFFYQENSYVDQVEEEIRGLFYRDQTNWKLQWILLYLQESLLENDAAKYEAVADQFRYGCRSRIMYLEAYQILCGNPFMMRHIGSFELQLLRFATRNGVMSQSLLQQTANLVAHYGKYSPLLLEVLKEGYRHTPEVEVLQGICQLLLRGERRDQEAFAWYEKGVNAGLRITGLYEAYMESMEHPALSAMPQIIRMYFAYDTTLDYRKRAAIYREIVERKEDDPQTFRTYRAAMEKFASDQLEMGRFTDDLAVLYRTFLRKSMLTRQMGEQLIRLLFSYEVTCTSPEICNVTVHSGRFVQEQSAVLSGGKARITLYDPDSVLVLENLAGERFAAEGLIARQKLFDSDPMLEWCMQLVPDAVGIVLFACCSCMKEQLVNRNSMPYLTKGCELELFTEEFRMQLRAAVLHYYSEHARDDSLPDFLERIAYLDYVKADKTALISLLAEEGACKDAFSLLDMYGSEGIPLLQLVRICSRMILDLEFAENPMLLSLSAYCFEKEKYNDKLLRYLLLYYEGPIENMLQVWEAARGFELDTLMIEEKILMMVLFTGSHTEGSEPVFESYAKKMGRRKLCRAYLNLKSYEYFVRGIPVADVVFRYLERDYTYVMEQKSVEEQEEVCRLALLQYYSTQVELTGQRREYASQLLEEFNRKGMRFAFWNKFDRELLAPYQMEGRVFAEYVGNPDSTVTIFYRSKGSEEEYHKETMKNCFEGIFVREFTLFYGDEVECRIEEEAGTERKETDERVLSFRQETATEAAWYDQVNRIARALKEQDLETADTELDNYLLLSYLAKELFPLI